METSPLALVLNKRHPTVAWQQEEALQSILVQVPLGECDE